MATPIHFIDGNCRMKQLKAGKSRKTCLTNRTRSISHHITPLVINGLGGGHTDTQTHAYRHADQNNFKKPGAHGLRPCAWFKITIFCQDCYCYKTDTEVWEICNYIFTNVIKICVIRENFVKWRNMQWAPYILIMGFCFYKYCRYDIADIYRITGIIRGRKLSRITFFAIVRKKTFAIQAISCIKIPAEIKGARKHLQMLPYLRNSRNFSSADDPRYTVIILTSSSVIIMVKIFSVLSISSGVKTYKYNFACIAMYFLVPLSPMQACLYWSTHRMFAFTLLLQFL